MMVRMRGRLAFTLLELLVALALMSVLAGALYASLRIGFRAYRAAGRTIEPVRALAIALDFLQRDVECAVPPTGILAGSFVGEDDTSSEAGKSADTLKWCACVGEPEAGKSDIVKIQIAVAELADGTGALVRYTTRNLLAPTVKEPAEELLCRNVAGLNLRYFNGASWVDSWDSTTQGNELPLAVEVTLELYDAGSDEENGHTLTRVVNLPCGATSSGAGTTVMRNDL